MAQRRSEATDAERKHARKAIAEEKKNLASTRQQAREMKRAAEESRTLLSKFKGEREKQGLSLAELAERTGISKGALSRLENGLGVNPTWSTLSRIATALGVRLEVRLKKPA